MYQQFIRPVLELELELAKFGGVPKRWIAQ